MLLLWCLWQFYNRRFNPHDLTVWVGMAFNRRDVLLRYWRYATWATFLVHLPKHFAALFRNCRRAPLHFFLGPGYLRFSLAIIPDYLLGLQLLTFLCSGWTRNSYDIDQSSLYRLLAFVLSTLAIGDCQASMLNRTWCGVSNSVNCTSSLSINSTSDCCCSFAGFDLSDCYPFETFAFPFSKASLMPCEMERMASLSPPAITLLPIHILLFIFLFLSLFISSSSYFLSFLSHGFFFSLDSGCGCVSSFGQLYILILLIIIISLIGICLAEAWSFVIGSFGYLYLWNFPQVVYCYDVAMYCYRCNDIYHLSSTQLANQTARLLNWKEK